MDNISIASDDCGHFHSFQSISTSLRFTQLREQSWAFYKQSKEGLDRLKYALAHEVGVLVYDEGCQGECRAIGGKWKDEAFSYKFNSASIRIGIQRKSCSSSVYLCVCMCVYSVMIYNPLCNKKQTIYVSPKFKYTFL